MGQNRQALSSGRIRKVEFIYDGSNEAFTRFLTSAAFEYLREEERKQIASNFVYSVEADENM